LHNYGKVRQLDLSVGIAYDTDLTLPRNVVGNILQHDPHVIKEPVAVFGISSLGESFITLTIKPWVGVENFVSAQAEVYQSLLKSFRDNNIEIPGPRHAVRLINASS